jgi:hypothetical protein
MIQTIPTINDFTQALKTYIDKNGVDCGMGYLFSTLKSLQLQSYELEKIQRDTKHLQEIAIDLTK